MSVYKAFFGGRRAYWKPEQLESTASNILSTKTMDTPATTNSVPVCQPKQFEQIRKMMRKFKALKRSSIAKSTPSLNNLDYGENSIGPISSPLGSTYNQSDHQLDDDFSSVLDGFIDLSVLLPDGKQIRMPIHARTPMMDVLVQVTTSNGINAGGMMLKVPIDRPPGYLHYKPNMPIGKLECTNVEVVPKAVLCEKPRKQGFGVSRLPFEPTIRIQVDLPRNQKTFLRVSPHLTLGDIFRRICEEANLRPFSAYELRSAKAAGFPLSLDRRLGETGIVDFAIVSTSSSLCKSTNDILGAISRMSQEEKEKRKTRRFFGLLRRKPAAPQPDIRAEIQKVTLNGQAAVEMRSPEKLKRSSAKDRPLSMPPVVFEASDGETSSENANRLDSAVKPKKRQAPPPPAVPRTPLNVAHSSQLNNQDLALSSTDTLRSHHARRGSDSSSGYHGSSQPSPNPPGVSDTPGAANSSVRHTSGSEKSTFSYKSQASAERASPRNFARIKDEGMDAVLQKKKPKAPLPPAAPNDTDMPTRNSDSVIASPVATHSSVIKDDATMESDSRCSTPATAEDVDKTFQEVIQHIQKQISAEDDATNKLSEENYTGTAASGEVIRPATSADGHQQSVDGLETNEKRGFISELVIGTTKPTTSYGGAKTVTRPTLKPTNLDEPLPDSNPESRLHSNDKGNGEVERSVPSTQPAEQVPTSLSLQADGLLIIQASEEDARKLESANDQQASRVAEGGHHDGSTDIAPLTMQKLDIAERKAASEEKDTNRRFSSDDNGIRCEVTVVHVAEQNPKESVKLRTQKEVDPLVKRTVKASILGRLSSPFNAKASSGDRPGPASPDEPSPGTQHQATTPRVNLTSPRPSIVLHDPKKDMYPSMMVKSFEDEYYTKSQSSVAVDYVKAVRYGLASDFSAGKEEREKNKEKLEAAVAKKASTLEERGQRPNMYVRNGGLAKAGEALSSVSRETSIPPACVPSSATADDVSVQLQREYEKLQAMFADWQFRLKQNEAIIDTGRKLSPEQVLAFQRLQDEMMEQHRYVQELCARVQRLEKGSSAAPSASGPTAERLGVLEASMHSSRISRAYDCSSEGRESGPSKVSVSVINVVEPTEFAAAKWTLPTLDNIGKKPILQGQVNKLLQSTPPWAGKSQRVSFSTIPANDEGTAVWRTNLAHSTNSSSAANGYSKASSEGPRYFGSERAAQNGYGQEDRTEPLCRSSPPPAPPLPPPPIMPAETKMSSEVKVGTSKWKVGENSTKAAPKNNTFRRGNESGSGDPRRDLMDSIRNFGGSAGLRKPPTNEVTEM